MKINWDWWPSLLGFLCFRLVLKEKGVRIKWKFVSKSSFFSPKKTLGGINSKQNTFSFHMEMFHFPPPPPPQKIWIY